MRAELNQQPSQTRTRVLSIFEFVGHHRQTILLVVVFIALFTFFSMTEKKFLTTRNLTSMGFQLPEIGVLSLAMMITILTGGINLSVNATSNMSAVIAGLYLVKFVPKDASESQIWFALIIAMLIVLFVGLISGLLNGFFNRLYSGSSYFSNPGDHDFLYWYLDRVDRRSNGHRFP